MFKVILKGLLITLIGAFIMSSYVSWCAYGLYKSVQGDAK